MGRARLDKSTRAAGKRAAAGSVHRSSRAPVAREPAAHRAAEDAPVAPAVVTELRQAGVVEICWAEGKRRGERALARLAVAHGYRPEAGDRVLVAPGEVECYVVGVLHAARGAQIELPDGAHAALVGDALELRDADGRLLIRYAEGAAELCAAAGDLELSAPRGKVRLSAALDVEIHAERDLVHGAGRDLRARAARTASVGVGTDDHEQLRAEPDDVHLDAKHVHVRAATTEIASARFRLVAQQLEQVAKRFGMSVDQYELVADRLVEKARLGVREVADLLQTRVGRARTVVRSTFALWSKRTTLRSKEDTAIDGRKILLG